MDRFEGWDAKNQEWADQQRVDPDPLAFIDSRWQLAFIAGGLGLAVGNVVQQDWLGAGAFATMAAIPLLLRWSRRRERRRRG